MVVKKAALYFDSDRNQLPYSGNPATWCTWNDANILTVTQESLFDNDGVPVNVNSFSFDWPPISDRYSPVYVKYRVRDDQLGTQSNWSVPKTLYTAARYAIYKRRVAELPQKWSLVEVTKESRSGPYQESWAGRVQYAVGIWHVDGAPDASEGIASATDFSNRYILFATDPTSTTMNTKAFVV